MPKTAWSRWRSLTRHVLTKLTITSAPSHGLPALERTAERPPHFVLASKSRDKNGVLGMGAVPSLTLPCVIEPYSGIGQEEHVSGHGSDHVWQGQGWLEPTSVGWADNWKSPWRCQALDFASEKWGWPWVSRPLRNAWPLRCILRSAGDRHHIGRLPMPKNGFGCYHTHLTEFAWSPHQWVIIGGRESGHCLDCVGGHHAHCCLRETFGLGTSFCKEACNLHQVNQELGCSPVLSECDPLGPSWQMLIPCGASLT